MHFVRQCMVQALIDARDVLRLSVCAPFLVTQQVFFGPAKAESGSLSRLLLSPAQLAQGGRKGRGERPAQAHTEGREDAIGGEAEREERLTNGIAPFIYREESLLGRREEGEEERRDFCCCSKRERRKRKKRKRREGEKKASLASPAKATLAPTPQHKVHPRPGPQQPEPHVSTTPGPPGPSAPPSGSARVRRRPFCVVLFWSGVVDSSSLPCDCPCAGRAGRRTEEKGAPRPPGDPRPEGAQSWSPGPPTRALALRNGSPGRRGSVFVRYASV